MRGVEAVLAQVAGPTRLLLENQGSRKRDLGADLAELASMAAALDGDRVGICLDTCHAFVAGYDLRTEAGWRDALALLEREIGLDRLGIIHGNDSKGDLGSGLDRHAHIGTGYLGAPAFVAMGRIAALADRAVILETPQDGPEDDPRNLATIRALAADRRVNAAGRRLSGGAVRLWPGREAWPKSCRVLSTGRSRWRWRPASGGPFASRQDGRHRGRHGHR